MKEDLQRLGENVAILVKRYGLPFEIFKMDVYISPDHYKLLQQNALAEDISFVKGVNWYILALPFVTDESDRAIVDIKNIYEQPIYQLGEEINQLFVELEIDINRYELMIYFSQDNYFSVKKNITNSIPENESLSGVFVKGMNWEIYLMWKHYDPAS
jgi:hypothetical protein